MSTSAFIICGDKPKGKPRQSDDKIIYLDQTGSNQNVHIRVTNVTSEILKSLQPASRDLLDIATYVYVADSSVTRGGPTDIFGSHWSRALQFVIPVRNRSLWQQPNVVDQLTRTLGYLTGDSFKFSFEQHHGDEDQQYLEFENYTPYSGADCISLLSGGADSLAGALQLTAQGRRPVLVSHRSTAILDARQKRVRDDLAVAMPGWNFPHLSVWAHRSNSRASDYSQRSRSFLFLSLASVAAYELGMDEVFVPENGVVSLNLPKLEQTFGSRASRSTQPRFLHEFSTLFSAVFNKQMSISNPLLLKTKAEVFRLIADSGHPDIIQETVSCTHTMGMPVATPHCGVCSQCVDRRIAAIAAGVEEHDLAEGYQVDIFLEKLEGEGIQQAESYVRAAYRFESMDPDTFVSSHRQVTDAIPYLPGTSAQAAEALFHLHKRAAQQTLDALEKVVSRNASRLVRGELPDSCLMQLVGSSRFRHEPCELAANRIAEILSVDIPIRFKSTDPATEAELQDAVEAALKSANEQIMRESPVVPYSVVTTTPDFSTETTSTPLFIELKLVKDANSRRYAVKSIGEASTYYVDQGAFALFIVYDTDRWIVDHEAFAMPFEKKGHVMVRVIR